MLRLSDVVDNRYHLVERLGEGAFGTVWRARDERLDCDVAVKLLDKVRAEDRATRKRFDREAKLAARLHSPHIARVRDYGFDRKLGRFFICADLIEGSTVRDRLRQAGPLAPEHVARIALDVTSALQVAHASQIAHRDVHDGNVMLARDGRNVLLDFGIAKPVDGEKLTKTGSVIGVAPFIAPERWRGDPRADDRPGDAFSLGVLLYVALCNAYPHYPPMPLERLLRQQLLGPLPHPRLDGAPAGLQTAVRGLLESDPARRTKLSETRSLLEAEQSAEGKRQEKSQSSGLEPVRLVSSCTEIAAAASALGIESLVKAGALVHLDGEPIAVALVSDVSQARARRSQLSTRLGGARVVICKAGGDVPTLVRDYLSALHPDRCYPALRAVVADDVLHIAPPATDRTSDARALTAELAPLARALGAATVTVHTSRPDAD